MEDAAGRLILPATITTIMLALGLGLKVEDFRAVGEAHAGEMVPRSAERAWIKR